MMNCQETRSEEIGEPEVGTVGGEGGDGKLSAWPDLLNWKTLR